MTDLFGQRGFTTLVREVHKRLNGRCTPDDLVTGVKKVMTVSEYETWSASAFRRSVLDAAKTPTSKAGKDAVYSAGEHISTVQQMSFEEIEAKAWEVARLGNSHHRTVRELAALCDSIHGRTFDAEQIIAGAA